MVIGPHYIKIKKKPKKGEGVHHMINALEKLPEAHNRKKAMEKRKKKNSTTTFTVSFLQHFTIFIH